MLIDSRNRADDVATRTGEIAQVVRMRLAEAENRPDAAFLRRGDEPAADGGPELAFLSGQAGLRAFGHEAHQSNLLAFAGLRNRPADAKPADPMGSGVVVNGTVYEVRPYRKPTIRHDNGFLQNPNDPADPKPMPTRAPTEAERAFHRSEVIQATGGEVASKLPFADKADKRLGLDHALPAYRHFLTGNGADRTFDYAAYLRDDPSGRATAASAVADIRVAADQLYPTLDQKVGTRPGDSIRFQVQGDPTEARYPATEDWQKAIGGHTQWSSATVTVTRQKDGSLKAEADVTLRAEDRYNFNPGQKDIATGAPDAKRGVLEESGLAHQYTQRGEAKFSTSWTIGAPGAAGPATEGHRR